LAGRRACTLKRYACLREAASAKAGRASVAISRDCFTEFTLSKIMRFFASPRMTKSEGFAMTPHYGNLFMTLTYSRQFGAELTDDPYQGRMFESHE